MKYLEITCHIQHEADFIQDVLADLLSNISFESFVQEPAKLLAYIPAASFNETALQEVLKNFPFDAEITYEIKTPEEKNWNEEWEKNYFQPIIIDEKCIVKSSFHTNTPAVEYEILIDPKMAFGTGHHETTSSVISYLLEMELTGKKVLDMGCGTGILAILASMKGASPIVAIDIDDWCVNNTLDNLKLNRIDNIEVKLGDAKTIGQEDFDLIIANINRNILLNDMDTYNKSLRNGSNLLLSGFYTEDIPVIEKKANEFGLTLSGFKEKNNWVAVLFKKA